MSKVVLVLGSGATRGSGFKCNFNGKIIDPPTDIGFWNNLDIIDQVYKNCPALKYCLEQLGILKNGEAANIGYEESWNLLDMAHKYFYRNSKDSLIPSLNAWRDIQRKHNQVIDSINQKIQQEDWSYKWHKCIIDGDNFGKGVTGLADLEFRLLIRDIFANTFESEKNQFKDLLALAKTKNKSIKSIITFNYDLTIEQSLKSDSWYYPYLNGCPDSKCNCEHYNPAVYPQNRLKDDKSKISLIKLHGSINWEHLGNGKFQFPEDPLKATEKRGFQNQNISWNDFSQPAIIKPVIFKEEFHFPENHRKIARIYSTLWAKAQEELNDIDEILFIGYSFPASDPHARLLFRTANINTKTKIKLITMDSCIATNFESIFNREIFLKSEGFGKHLDIFDD